jgi:hypothetical protein
LQVQKGRRDAMNETHEGGHHEMHGAPAGLASTADGLTLETGWIAAEDDEGRSGKLEFRISGPDGKPVRDFDEQHGRAMHLMVVRRDLTHYRHLHPRMDAEGTWSTPLAFPEPGVYRVFADFATAGRGLTLGTDLEVPGPYKPAPLPAPEGVARTGGYEVSLDADLHAEGLASLVFGVSRGGRGVHDLEPYLGALGHLVALREGDLAFLHVHPEAEEGSGPRVAFRAAFPSEGRYRLFLQFAHANEVHTAAFTVEV